MARKHLSKNIDIHAGGADLMFPHHENEIAQSECANDCEFSKYWMHNGFVTINKEKMSKSLGNFLTIDDILAKYNSNTIRLFILTNHYRMPVEFSDEALNSAQAGAQRLQNAVNNVLPFVADEKESDVDIKAVEDFKAAMDDDLNTAKALAVLFDLANTANKAKDTADKISAKKAITTMLKLSEVLGFDFSNIEIDENILFEKLSPILSEFDFLTGIENPKAVLEKILKVRNQARAEKNWELADLIRNTLAKAGVGLKDTKDGTIWELKNK